ncbi:hypothetical protein CIPAW_01G006900 [Carya illinoinensis]|uniref:Uncharacterized protein n=1 Tax=Carya illinoinensis TaxID=32201 RepID=A0A8T1RF23_CARIL|nr:hypothetical protein CIPAW_01G006900 [Carya illinoinensis]KAG6666100.1 hypothetical protein CIPAW_01G006900 [Carya illinoinensis]
MPTPPSPFHFRYTPTPLLLLSCCTLPSLILKFSVNRFFYLPSLSLSQLGFVLHAFASFYFSGSVEQRCSLSLSLSLSLLCVTIDRGHLSQCASLATKVYPGFSSFLCIIGHLQRH